MSRAPFVFSPVTLRRSAEDALRDSPALMSVARRVADEMTQGGHERRKSGGHETFRQYRDYHDTDRPQDIDWRQSAKQDRVFVRERELQTPQSVYFWCDRGANMDFQSDQAQHSKRNAARILSLALAIAMQRSDEQIGFISDSGSSRAGRSDAALQKLAQGLLEDMDAAHNLPAGKAAQNSTMIFCGDFLQPIAQIRAAFDLYAARHRRAVIVQVLDPAELDLPYSGNIVFEGTSADQQHVENVRDVRDAYQARMRAHIADLKDLAHRYGWHYTQHRTDADFTDSLMDAYGYLERHDRIEGW